MEIDIKEYFTEIIDESRSTIGYNLNPYKDIDLVQAIYEQNEQLQQLKEENDELKKGLNWYHRRETDLMAEIVENKEDYAELLQRHNDSFAQFNELKEENVKLQNRNQQLSGAITQNLIYIQKLEKIKAIVESAMAKQQEYKKDFEQILDLITKAEVENERN